MTDKIYVINTDKGYLKGDMLHGVYFVSKEEARRFTLVELNLYWDSIWSDLSEFFDCKSADSEKV